MTTQPLLLDVPRNQTRLDRWKQLHDVTTMDWPELPLTEAYDEDRPCHGQTWCCYQETKNAGAFSWSSLIGEGIGAGMTEEDACFDWAERNGVPWTEGLERPRITP